MVDIVDKKTRKRMMAGIKGKDTQPEILIRKALHKQGFRYQLHEKKLPGKPDLVFPKYKAVIQIHGCFWHRHNCHLFKWPSTRVEFWKNKIDGNAQRDLRNIKQLNEQGWRVLIVWECATKGKERMPLDKLVSKIESWLRFGKENQEIGS